MGDLKNELSWSPSRGRLLRECERAYYWRYYGSWGGWERSAPAEARKAYMLKQMTHPDMWPGSIVHEAIEWCLQQASRGEVPSKDDLREKARQLFLRDWFDSLDGNWRQRPKKHVNLHPHYYDHPFGAEDCARVRDRAFACLDRFLDSSVLAEIMNARGRWLAMESLMSFGVDGVKVFVKPDFARRGIASGEQVVVYDWKTGKEREEDVFQMHAYALFARAEWRVEDVEVVLVYLGEGGTTRRARPSRAHLDEALTRIRKEIAVCRKKVPDAQGEGAAIGNFELARRERLCRRCNFYELCEPELREAW